jgi:DNA-binding MurR/RpiR family transcriptional regulator
MANTGEAQGEPADPPLEGRILDLYGRLPAGERRLADVVLERARDLAGYTAGELAAAAGVSNATAARFFRRLGFGSYAEARRAQRPRPAWGSPLEGMGADRPATSLGAAVGRHLTNDIRNLTRTFEALDTGRLARAVELLERARKVRVGGFRNSFALAAYAAGVMSGVRPDVRLLPGAGLNLAEDLAGLAEGDALLAVGFRRRPPVLGRIMAAARELGADVVYLTDLSASRSAEHATLTLRCHSRGSAMFDSYVAPVSLLNLLCSALACRLGPRAHERLSRVERLHRLLEDVETGNGGPATPDAGSSRI